MPDGVEGGGGMMSKLEKELSEKCFEAEREACRCHQAGDMSLYGLYLGKSEAYRTAAQMVEKY